MNPQLRLDDAVLAAFCARHGIRRLSLFGSLLKGSARPDSDVDLLVEFETGRVPGLMGMAAIEAELSRLLGGRQVDLRILPRTSADISATRCCVPPKCSMGDDDRMMSFEEYGRLRRRRHLVIHSGDLSGDVITAMQQIIDRHPVADNDLGLMGGLLDPGGEGSAGPSKR